MKSIKSINRAVEIGLRLTGIWPGSSYVIIIRSFWVTVMTAAQAFQFRYIIKHINSGNLTNLIDSVATSLPYSLFCFKLVSLWIKRGMIENLLIEMSDDWAKSFELNTHLAMINKAELGQRCSTLIMGVYALASIVYAIVFIEFVYQDEGEESAPTSRDLLMKMDFPFAYYESPTYELVFVIQFFQLVAVASAIGMLDALIIILMFHIGGQIEILHGALTDISEKDGKHGLSRSIVKFLIDKHCRIIDTAEYVENLFSYIALMQLLCNTLVICCIGFTIVIALNTHEDIKALIRILLFYVAITLEAFIFSFAGEYLSTKSLALNKSAYDSLWYYVKPSDRRFVILMMIRSQRHLTLTAGKFADLSLEGFANSLKASASYVSVLYAMY